jgi:hypothetical protein
MHDLTGATWRKSRFSGSGNACVEVADLTDRGRAVRDSKDPAGPVLAFPAGAWTAFTAGIRGGDFD